MMLEKKTVEFINELSSAAPVPGGGGACATVGALAAALGMMVANLTVGKKKYAEVEEEIISLREQLLELQKELIELCDEDARVFEPLSKAYGLPKNTEEEKAYKEKVMEKVLYEASIVPIRIMESVRKSMDLLKILGEKGSLIAISDVGVAAFFAQAALEGASLNVFINTKSMKTAENVAELEKKADMMIAEGKIIKEEICSEVMKKIRPLS